MVTLVKKPHFLLRGEHGLFLFSFRKTRPGVIRVPHGCVLGLGGRCAVSTPGAPDVSVSCHLQSVRPALGRGRTHREPALSPGDGVKGTNPGAQGGLPRERGVRVGLCGPAPAHGCPPCRPPDSTLVLLCLLLRLRPDVPAGPGGRVQEARTPLCPLGPALGLFHGADCKGPSQSPSGRCIPLRVSPGVTLVTHSSHSSKAGRDPGRFRIL